MIKKHRKKIIIILAFIIIATGIGAIYIPSILNAAANRVYTVGEKTTKTFSQAQLVKYKNDTFYSLNDVDACDTTMEIFAIYNLNSTGTAQVNDTYSNTKCAFSSSQYWSSTNQNINNIPGGDTDVTYCVPRIKKYALDKGAINGRLLTYEEANAIANGTNDDAKNMLWGRQNTNQTNSLDLGYLSYWLGSSYSDFADYVWRVNGDNSSLYAYSLTLQPVNFSNSNYIRGSPSFNSLNIWSHACELSEQGCQMVRF